MKLHWNIHYLISTTGYSPSAVFAVVNYDPVVALCRCPVSSQSALDASGRHDPKGSGAFPGHEPRHLVQSEASNCLSIHLQNFITDAEETHVGALATTVTHFLYIYTWEGNRKMENEDRCKIYNRLMQNFIHYRIDIKQPKNVLI